MKLMPSVYACPICGLLRGGNVNRGKHEACYRIQQERQAEANAKKEKKRMNREATVKRRYLSGCTVGVKE